MRHAAAVRAGSTVSRIMSVMVRSRRDTIFGNVRIRRRCWRLSERRTSSPASATVLDAARMPCWAPAANRSYACSACPRSLADVSRHCSSASLMRVSICLICCDLSALMPSLTFARRESRLRRPAWVMAASITHHDERQSRDGVKQPYRPGPDDVGHHTAGPTQLDARRPPAPNARNPLRYTRPLMLNGLPE